MPRDMTGTGRYPPVPRYAPFAFYSAVRLGDPELLGKIMSADPYFITQDNGAGAPIHFAVTYRQLDMVHHLLNNGAVVNQRDGKGFTPLHRAAYLAHLDGYMEMYEYLLSRGADPSILSEEFDPYLNPGRKLAVDMAVEEGEVRDKLRALEKKYAGVPKAPRAHPDIGDWWTLYDYGLEVVRGWDKDYKHTYPEDVKRQRDREQRKKLKEHKAQQRQAFYKALAEGGPAAARALAAAAAANAAKSGDVAAAGDQNKVPDTPVAFLFPGQGSQAVGMLKESSHLPAVQRMLATAKEILGFDLLDVCNNGPKEKLDDTVYSQPALYVAGLAAVEKLRSENPEAVARCSAAAGLSLGEYSALVFAGGLSFEDGLKVVKVRAQSMAAAARQGSPHGMLSVVGLPDPDLQQLCSQVAAEVAVPGGTVCQLANYLFPQGRVLSGHLAALERLRDLALSRGAMKAQLLAVSGAFHTRLMEPARQDLVKVLETVTFHTPRIPVYGNVTSQPFPSADELPGLLARQLVEPVQWQATLEGLIRGAGKKELYELGPGQQIKAMVKRVDQEAWKALKNIGA